MEETIPKILIVDDSRANLSLISHALSKYETMEATSGEEALKIAKKTKPDLILLDVIMQGIDGYEVCRHLKEDDDTKEIPVIFLTAQTSPECIVKGFNTGAIDYVIKPFNMEELVVRVNTQLALKKSRDDNKKYLDEISHINKILLDSINYAKRIQQAGLPNRTLLNQILPEYSILYKPKDIVSGDFYWAKKLGDKVIVVVADCTGHGVPGAFMCMFGIASLVEIIGKEGHTKPSDILEQLRNKIFESLKAEEGEEALQDGMDVSILTFSDNFRKVEFAGAHSSIYLVRDKTVTVYKGNILSIGLSFEFKPYQNVEIELFEGDCLYQFTDGYVDQFGGHMSHKFGKKRFQQLILENHKKPMKEQIYYYENCFMKWTGEYEQIDDVLILGIRV